MLDSAFNLNICYYLSTPSPLPLSVFCSDAIKDDNAGHQNAYQYKNNGGKSKK